MAHTGLATGGFGTAASTKRATFRLLVFEVIGTQHQPVPHRREVVSRVAADLCLVDWDRSPGGQLDAFFGARSCDRIARGLGGRSVVEIEKRGDHADAVGVDRRPGCLCAHPGEEPARESG